MVSADGFRRSLGVVARRAVIILYSGRKWLGCWHLTLLVISGRIEAGRGLLFIVS